MSDEERDIADAVQDDWTVTDNDRDRAANEIRRLRAENGRLKYALAKLRYPCTCHEAYVGRGMVDPNCMASKVGDWARAALGEPLVCRGNAAFKAKLDAALDGEGE